MTIRSLLIGTIVAVAVFLGITSVGTVPWTSDDLPTITPPELTVYLSVQEAESVLQIEIAQPTKLPLGCSLHRVTHYGGLQGPNELTMEFFSEEVTGEEARFDSMNDIFQPIESESVNTPDRQSSCMTIFQRPPGSQDLSEFPEPYVSEIPLDGTIGTKVEGFWMSDETGESTWVVGPTQLYFDNGGASIEIISFDLSDQELASVANSMILAR